MPLTSQIKELEAILQKLIKTWIDPCQKWRWKTFNDVDGDADNFFDEVWARCNNETNEIVLLQELEEWENKAVLVSVWLKESY